MTKETANIIGLLINILIVAMLTFIDDYVYKTLNIDYLKFEFQDSFLWNTTHAVLGDILPEIVVSGVAVAITAYLIYLAWKMIGSFDMVKKEIGRPLRFYEASLFQFINPKAWSIAITVASGFFPTEENILIGILFVTITAAVICFPSICVWALFGSSLKKYISDYRVKKYTEYSLALMVVSTGFFILLK